MKLKTLKDIERESAGYLCDENTNEVFEENPNFILPDEAKALAIKWINSHRYMNKDDFIVWFFNITEEDLK